MARRRPREASRLAPLGAWRLGTGGRRARAAPVMVLAAVAFVIGVLAGAGGGSSSARALAVSFTRAWTRGDYAQMYLDTDPLSQHARPVSAFAASYRRSDELATVLGRELDGSPRAGPGGSFAVPVSVRTRVFGRVRGAFLLEVTGSGASTRIHWSPTLLFPGLRPGERLSRHLALPPRAALLARDGAVLADGPAVADGTRTTPLGAAMAAVVGRTGTPPASRHASLLAAGVPPGALVGLSGLERALDDRLRGAPGGELLAGQRVLASARAQSAAPVRTTISPALQLAAVQALGGLLGGVVVMRPADGEILAVAGLGTDGLQPPGSTFKIITLTAALAAGVATPSSTYPLRTAAVLDGVQLQNANGETCGGTLAQAFALSCNSVFAPLGAQLGAGRLVGMAQRFGFNGPSGLAGAPPSTLPPAAQIVGDLAVGSTAIGQDRVLASPLQMTVVAATIADQGRRPSPSVVLGERGPSTPVTSPAIALTVRRLMIGVVRSGTGTAAAIPGVAVAGKTGTAELQSTAPSCPAGSAPGSPACPTQAPANPGQNTDAWFAAFAPASAPRVAVGVLLVRDGAGGTTAAPVARQVLQAGLQRGA